jgi:hypothetical protein
VGDGDGDERKRGGTEGKKRGGEEEKIAMVVREVRGLEHMDAVARG